MRAGLLCLLLAASSSAAGLPEPTGEGAQRLVAGAMKVARRRFHADACLAGLRIDLAELCGAEHAKPALYNRFEYFFYSPSHPLERYSVDINDQASDGSCESPATGRYTGHRASLNDYAEESCITEMTLDSEGAAGVAALSGLDEGLGSGVAHHERLYLRRAADAKSAFWKFEALRGKTFWDVVDYVERRGDERSRNVVVDAKDGKVLLVNRRLPLE